MLTKSTPVVAKQAQKELRNRLDKIDKDMTRVLLLLEENLTKLDKKLEEQELMIVTLKRNMNDLRDNMNINRAIVTGKQATLTAEIKRDIKLLAIKGGIVLLAGLALAKVLFL